MGNIKIRADFHSNASGIDSNTISAGEDNLYIIIAALVSLKYYYYSIHSQNEVESILLVDELDATLHPSIQFKLIELFRDYAEKYKIQITFTTHSISLLECALKEKCNVLYLIDNVTTVIKMPFPDIYKIKMHLHNITKANMYAERKIPVFTEDAEARLFLERIFSYLEDNTKTFSSVRRFFHLVDANIGAKNLENIFKDDYLLKSTLQALCLLDGDQKNQRKLSRNVTCLPGNSSPEKMIMEYSIQLYNDDDPFWIDDYIIELNFGKVYYRDNIRPAIDNIMETIKKQKEQHGTVHGVERELRKKVFKEHENFFSILFKHWLGNIQNKNSIEMFYGDLGALFKKVSTFHGINPLEWDRTIEKPN